MVRQLPDKPYEYIKIYGNSEAFEQRHGPTL